MNCAKKPFDDPKVRRAVHLALSRQDVFEAFKTQEPLNFSRYMSHGSEYATPPADVVKLPGYRADKSEDVAAAKKLLAEAGYPEGLQGIDFLSATVAPHAQIMAPAVQASLKASLNIDSTIRAVERAVLNDEQKTGKYDLCVNTIGYPLYDPTLGWIDYFMTKGPANLSQYSNPKIDTMLKQLDAEVDSAKRKTLMGEIETLLDQEPPWLTIGFTDHLHMWRAHIKGLSLDKRVRNQWGKTDIMWVDK
jgi:ABC-type transport system substrate-binding protein